MSTTTKKTTSTTKKSTTNKKTTSAPKKTTSASKKTTSANSAPVESKVVETPAPVVATPMTAVDNIDPNQYVPVYNGFHGRLIYISRKTGEEFIWENYGDVQEMELIELRNAKSSSRAFFENNWFTFDDDHKWLIDYLGVRAYYKHAVGLQTYDKIFELSTEEIQNTVANMNKAQRDSMLYRTQELINSGAIDSHRLILDLEKILGVELIEH